MFASVIAWLAIAVIGWLGWQLLKQNGRILLRLDELEKRLNELEFGKSDEPEGLPVGTEAPLFELPKLNGELGSLAQFRGKPALLIFFNPDCGYCRGLLPRLAPHSEGQAPRVPNSDHNQLGPGLVDLSPPVDEKPQLLFITTADAEKNRRLFAEHEVRWPILLQKQSEVADAYQVNGTPGGYLVDSQGRIASALSMGGEALLALAEAKPERDQSTLARGPNGPEDRVQRFRNRSLTRSKIKRDGLKGGTPAPDFRLPRLDGLGDVTLSDLRGRKVLLVFSSPGCGPCNALAPELAKFHRQHPEMELVMVSKGERKENRAKVREHGLTFPVVLQQQWEISRRYAMFATPVAYLIDESGIIARDVAVGGEAIAGLLKLAGEQTPKQAMASV